MERFYLLDIARGVAAVAVAIFHYKLFYAYNLSSENFVPENQPFYDYIKLISNLRTCLKIPHLLL